MVNNGSTANARRNHPVATAVGWFFGVVAALLSVFFVFMVATLISEWPSYVGSDSGTASGVVALVGILTLGAWALAAAAIYTVRRT
jgi:hypothetical protein